MPNKIRLNWTSWVCVFSKASVKRRHVCVTRVSSKLARRGTFLAPTTEGWRCFPPCPGRQPERRHRAPACWHLLPSQMDLALHASTLRTQGLQVAVTFTLPSLLGELYLHQGQNQPELIGVKGSWQLGHLGVAGLQVQGRPKSYERLVCNTLLRLWNKASI